MDNRSKLMLIEELIRDEGEVLHAYNDSLGKSTIGVGHLNREGYKTISHAESRYLLSRDIDEVVRQLDLSIPWWQELSENRQRVLANMGFNLGVLRLCRFHKMLYYCGAEEYALAADEMMKSKWASQVGERAHRLAEMMKKG